MHRSVLLTTLALAVLLPGAAIPQTRPTIEAERMRAMRSYLMSHFQTPEDYVLSRFEEHDVVLIGEMHRIRHDVELVQRLIPLLHDRGIHALGTEFARRVDQPLVDSLLSLPEWDEELGRTILLRQFVAWGFREYLDVMKAAWALNRSLPEDARQFRILALNNAPDWSQVRTQADREDPAVRRKVWHGETEEDWARPVLDYVARGEKILLHTGLHHAFTHYRQPVVQNGEFVRFGTTRLGNHLYEALGDRTFLVVTHAVWPPVEGYGGSSVRAADGYLDAFFETMPSGLQRVGFDVRGTPFGRIPGETSLYSLGYDAFTLETMADGYIYHGPFCEFESVRGIPDFITEENLEFVRENSVNPSLRTASAEYYNQVVARSADLSGFCDQLESWDADHEGDEGSPP